MLTGWQVIRNRETNDIGVHREWKSNEKKKKKNNNFKYKNKAWKAQTGTVVDMFHCFLPLVSLQLLVCYIFADFFGLLKDQQQYKQ